MAIKTTQLRRLALGASILLAAASAMAGANIDVQVNLPGAYSPPVVVQPAPVYVQPRPVYVQPAPVYVQPAPVHVQPRTVVVAPAPVYVERDDRYWDCKKDKCKRKKDKHHKHHHHDHD
jgi:hypothetical protein